MGVLQQGAVTGIAPTANKQVTAGSYLDFQSAAGVNFAQQYLPELLEKEAEVFGNRSLSGFLEKVGAEEASASDQVVWSEQGRLHISAAGTIADGTDLAAGKITATGHGVRIGDTIVLTQVNVGTLKCYVSGVNDDDFTVKPYTQAALNTSGGSAVTFTAAAVTGFVYGSEYGKGLPGRGESLEPEFTSYSNQMFIMKDKYEVSGSDASQIGWVEVSGEEGQSGYLWYLKAAGDTKARFTDYCEMALVEAEKLKSGNTNGAPKGSEGLFSAIDSRGIVCEADANGSFSLATEFDVILKEFDKQGAIEEYVMFLDRSAALDIDDMLAGQNSYGDGGTSYGVFNNSEDMAINLGFSGFRRGSYDFYKTDWKYLNDGATRGALNGGTADVKKGVMVPAGVTSVYDQGLGKNLKRPFLHVRYRAAGIEDRRFKTWTTGSVGATTSDLDAMEMHFLTERCLVVQGANNFCTLVG
jgi:hypothetical protein